MTAAACLSAAAASAAVPVSLVAIGSPARAVPVSTIPPDVRAAFAGAVRADDIHEIFAFSADFIDGAPTTEPVTSTGQRRRLSTG